MNNTIIVTSEGGYKIATTIATELGNSQTISTIELDGVAKVDSLSGWMANNFSQSDSIIIVGATGIAVRLIAPHLDSKYNDPAVVSVDSTGSYSIALLSGHVGGANELCQRVANILGAEAVITTQSDKTNLWALDTLAGKYGWRASEKSLNSQIATFVNLRPTALLLDICDRGTEYLERTKPAHVEIFYNYELIEQDKYDLIIAVTPYIYSDNILHYHPASLHLGVGCRKDCSSDGVVEYIEQQLAEKNISIASIASISTIDIKSDEPLIAALKSNFSSELNIYTADDIKGIETPNPSAKVEQVTGSTSVSEASAIASSNGGKLIIEKQKGRLTEGNDFTFAVALDRTMSRGGHIEIVGAGPGDPELVSVRGRNFLERADLILYAGSLVPVELTHYAKSGAVVRSSAPMNLEEQFAIMKEFYDMGKLVVRLHTGDPCIYGAIQEQMNYFDLYDMSYHITPGISSFQAAAAALRSQFTIPERVQTIILTRGEGRTAMPEKEKLHLLARSQSTMCIFLSASIVDDIQRDLMEHYPAKTPVAACYKLTWRDERIYRGELKDLSKIVKENNLTLTTMIVVGEAIDNRKGLSRLYADEFKHIFRR